MSRPLDLANILCKNILQFLCTVLGVSLLSPLIVYVRHTESSLVAFGPFEIAIASQSYFPYEARIAPAGLEGVQRKAVMQVREGLRTP